MDAVLVRHRATGLCDVLEQRGQDGWSVHLRHRGRVSEVLFEDQYDRHRPPAPRRSHVESLAGYCGVRHGDVDRAIANAERRDREASPPPVPWWPSTR